MIDHPVDDRYARREARRTQRDLPWLGGAVLIAIGVFLLIQNLGGPMLDNWWALFILIPAIASLGRAWQGYQAEQRIGPAVTGPLFGGILLTMLASAFLLDLSLGVLWPIFLIVLGIGSLATAFARS